MLINIISILIGISGLVASYVFYKKSVKSKKLSVSAFSSVLISNKLTKYKKLQFSYAGQNITSLANSTIKITNIGTDTIEASDFYKDKPITIHSSSPFLSFDDDIMQIETVNSDTEVTLTYINDNVIQLNFEALKPKDAIVVNLLHSGSISISASLKNGNVFTSPKNNDISSIDKISGNTPDEDDYDKKNSFLNFFMKLFLMITFSVILTFFLIEKNQNIPLADFLSSDENIFIIIATLAMFIGFYGNFKFK